MRQPSRKSAASFAIMPPGDPPPPEPPKAFTDEQKAIWDEVIASVRPSWFVGSLHILESYCVTIWLDRWLVQEIAARRPGSKQFEDLVAMRRSQAALLGQLATKLRLTPRSVVDRTVVRNTSGYSGLPKPWEIGSGERFDEESEDPEGSPPAA
jgi:hypothetical protein